MQSACRGRPRPGRGGELALHRGARGEIDERRQRLACRVAGRSADQVACRAVGSPYRVVRLRVRRVARARRRCMPEQAPIALSGTRRTRLLRGLEARRESVCISLVKTSTAASSSVNVGSSSVPLVGAGHRLRPGGAASCGPGQVGRGQRKGPIGEPPCENSPDHRPGRSRRRPLVIGRSRARLFMAGVLGPP